MTTENKPTHKSSKAEQQKKQEINSHLLATGLEDYGFWWEEMLKEKSHQSEPEKPFRRGRIWC
jgi:cyanobactin cluster PatC/TenC/TruC protein